MFHHARTFQEREAKERAEKEAREKEKKKEQQAQTAPSTREQDVARMSPDLASHVAFDLQDAAAKLLQSVQAEILSTPAAPLKAQPPAHVQALFKEPEELDANGQPRKHKPLTRLDGPPAPERKLRDDEMKRLIQQVPTDKARAFAFDIDWDAVHEPCQTNPGHTRAATVSLVPLQLSSTCRTCTQHL
ncbi:unnamed protein product [Durusdinium trenchii]|uniref:Ribosome biogenesis protein NOP53 n=1 Tax=Durusdinium trenchii TaxID=1381693 RepID=A0ABP0SQC6_9DINO